MTHRATSQSIGFRPFSGRSVRSKGLATLIGLALLAALLIAGTGPVGRALIARMVPVAAKPALPPPPMRLGINLFGLAPFNRQQVFANLIAQSEWFSSKGAGWTAMPAERLDTRGWVTRLDPGQTAPRPLVLPPVPFDGLVIRCVWRGTGHLTVGGIARERARDARSVTFALTPTGSADEGAWIELARTDPADPVRDIDCRDIDRPATERFHPDALALVRDFRAIRFLDWQRTNDNAPADWARRTRPYDSSQSSAAGASIEDMVDLANLTGADPWFLIPYRAGDEYIAGFARLVHERLDPRRIAYVELGNEVWNEMFPAALQARREGLAMGLGGGDPMRAQMLRYADKTARAMRIWTKVFADRPARLVRVAASQNAWPDLAEMILGRRDTATWVDALATAPYIWIDLDGRTAGDLDWVFARMPGEIDKTIEHAERNRAIALRHGKRFIAYEGGQHLVTRDLEFARRIQRDPRMAGVYRSYLEKWRARVGDQMMLYASTAPIADYGSWGLREYAGQPMSETPKLGAVRRFAKTVR